MDTQEYEVKEFEDDNFRVGILDLNKEYAVVFKQKIPVTNDCIVYLNSMEYDPLSLKQKIELKKKELIMKYGIDKEFMPLRINLFLLKSKKTTASSLVCCKDCLAKLIEYFDLNKENSNVQLLSIQTNKQIYIEYSEIPDNYSNCGINSYKVIIKWITELNEIECLIK